MNENFYYSKVDNIFELSYDQTIEYAKQNGYYFKEAPSNDSFHKILI